MISTSSRVDYRPFRAAVDPARSLTSEKLGSFVWSMDLPDDDQSFLRDLVKTARQKPHHVKWIDRDGAERVTTFTQTEVVRSNRIAQKLGISKSELLRRAAHVPVAKTPLPAVPQPSAPPQA